MSKCQNCGSTENLTTDEIELEEEIRCQSTIFLMLCPSCWNELNEVGYFKTGKLAIPWQGKKWAKLREEG